MTLEVNPNWVQPGWTPLLITLALAGILVLLFLSMRRQFRKINAAGDQLPTEQSLRERRTGEPPAAKEIRIDQAGVQRTAEPSTGTTHPAATPHD